MGSLFDGIGGFILAGTFSKIDTLWSSEIDPCCEAVTKNHFPYVEQLGDITKINGASVKPVNIICGGSPCQDLSVAGSQRGLFDEKGNATRSGLYMQQIRIIREMLGATNNLFPRYMVWENVPGALSSNKGEDFHEVIEEAAQCAEIGVSVPKPKKWSTSGLIMGSSWSIAWRVLDAEYWGVPQRRRRIFLVADFAGHSAGEVLFKPESLRRNTQESGETWKPFSRNIAGSANGGLCIDCRNHCVNPISATLQAKSNGGQSLNYINPVFVSAYSGDVAATLDASYYKGPGARNGKEREFLATLSPQNNRKYIVRRLTPLECERLQGYSDNWTNVQYNNKPMTDSVRYRMLGNSVAIPCVVYVLSGISDC